MFITIAKVEDIVECFHNPTYKYNYHKWSSLFCSNEESNEMRRALAASHEYIEKNQVKFLVVDLKNCINAFSEEDQAWINEHAIPNEKRIGIEYFVTIVSPNLYSELSMEDWQEKTRDFMTFINVQTLEDAESWIHKKQMKNL